MTQTHKEAYCFTMVFWLPLRDCIRKARSAWHLFYAKGAGEDLSISSIMALCHFDCCMSGYDRDIEEVTQT